MNQINNSNITKYRTCIIIVNKKYMETSKRRNLIIDMITIESIYIIKKFPRYHATTNTNARNIFTKELLLVALKYSYRFNMYRFRNRIINL